MDEQEIVAGGYYRTRNGERIGPLRGGGTSPYVWVVTVPAGTRSYARDGRYLVNSPSHEHDLVERLPQTDELVTGREKVIFDYSLADYREAAEANKISPV